MVERTTFVEHLIVDERVATFGAVLRQSLQRIERDTRGLTAPPSITLVRRMSLVEVARLKLEPRTGTWFEVEGDMIRIVPHA